MLLPKIALRNLSRQKKRSFLLGGALAFGMLILVAVNGFTGGLISSIQKNFASLIAGHIYFMQFEKSPEGRLLNVVKDDAALLKSVDELGLEYTGTSRRTMLNGSVVLGSESLGRAITGVDWKEDKSLARDLVMVAGTAQNMAGSDGIIISTSVAAGLGLLPKKTLSYKERHDLKLRMREENKAKGPEFNLTQALDAEIKRQEEQRKTSQKELAAKVLGEELTIEMQTIYGQGNSGVFRVVGIYEAQFDIAVYVDREKLNILADMPRDSYNLFGLTLKDYSGLDMKTALLFQTLGKKYNFVPLEKVAGRSSDTIIPEIRKEDFNGSKTLLTNLNNEMGSFIFVLYGVQIGSFGLFLVVLAVIMVGLVNTFRIVIYERTKEIGTMRAVGTQKSQIRTLFLLEALFLALGGTIPGAILGYLVLGGLRLMEFSSITEMGLFLDGGRLGAAPDMGIIILSFIMVVVFTLIAALLPARRAAKMEPAVALRTQF